MDDLDPELALEKAVQRLDSESSASDSEVGSEPRSVVDSSVELEMFRGPTVNKEQAFALYRHFLMQSQPINQTVQRGNHLNSLQNSVTGSEENSSVASFE